MRSLDATQVLPTLAWSDPRVHLLDDTWVLSIFAILIAIAVPWLVTGFDINFVAVTLGLLVLGAIHAALTLIERPGRAEGRRSTLMALHAVGVITIGFIWLHAGGLQNPAFLLVFVLPVISAIFVSRWQPYFIALLAIAVASAVALSQAPELRWYVPGFNAAGAWLSNTLGVSNAAADSPFPGFYAPSSYFIVLFQVFAILTIACAIAAEYLGTVFERLHAHVAHSRLEAERGQTLWINLIEDLPLPAILVDADTLAILCASSPASAFCNVAPSNGKNLLDTIGFSYPEVVQELIAGAGGVTPLTIVKVGDRLHMAVVSVQHMAQKGRRLALVTIVDRSEEFQLRAALDATEQAILCIGSRGNVLAFNKPAAALFAGIEKDAPASQLLSLTPMSGTTTGAIPARWWDPGIRGRRKMHIEIAPRVYQVTCLALPLPGEEEPNYVVTFMPVARAALGDRTAVIATGPLSEFDPSLSDNTMVTPP